MSLIFPWSISPLVSNLDLVESHTFPLHIACKERFHLIKSTSKPVHSFLTFCVYMFSTDFAGFLFVPLVGSSSVVSSLITVVVPNFRISVSLKYRVNISPVSPSSST